MTTHDQVLQDRVGQLRMRIRALLAQQGACIGLTGAMLAGLTLVAATKFQWWTDGIDYLWALLLAGAVGGIVYGATRRISPMVAAQIADDRAGLKERLSTAVELAHLESRSEMANAQIADAAQHAQELRPGAVIPWRAPRQWPFFAAAAAVLAAAIIVPDLPLFQTPQQRLDREAMRTQGVKIQSIAKEIEKRAKKSTKGDENAAIARRIALEMKRFGKDQERGRISKKQAMLKMNELTKQLRDAEDRATGGKSQKSLDRVAADLRQAAAKSSQKGNGENAKALQQMAQNLEKRDMDGAKKQLEELAQKMQQGKMSADDARQASDMLEQMAQSMEGSGLEKASQEMKDAAKQLQKAADAAKQFQQKMASAKTDAERQQLQQQMSQAMQQGMAQAGEQCAKAGGT